MRGAVATVLLALSFAPTARAASRRKELGRIQAELTRTKNEIEQFRGQQETLGRDLQHLQSGKTESRRRLAEVEKGLGRARSRQAELSGELAALRTTAGAWRQALSAEWREYAAAWLSREPAYGRGGLWSEAFRRGALREKAVHLRGLQGLGQRTELDAAKTGAQSREMVERQRRAREQGERVEAEYRQKKAAFDQTQESLAAALKRAAELEETAKALAKLIEGLGRGDRRRKTAAAAPWDVPARSLPWPVEGMVVGRFGRQRNEALGTWTIHEGIRVETAPAAEVRALRRGRVIFSGPFRSYGQVVIVDHGSEFYSVYGELGERRRSKGDSVSLGEALGRAGTGPGGKGAVYLELRRASQALDPLLWLKPSGSARGYK